MTKKTRRMPNTTVIQMSPLGWWLNYKEDQWAGPFKTPEEAQEEAEILVPVTYPEYHLLQVAPWERRTIKNTKRRTP